MQPAGRIDDGDVEAARLRRAHAVENDRGRIRAFRAANHRTAAALGPDDELFGRGGSERVGRNQQHALSFLVQARCELTDRRRLAAAVDADDQHHGRHRLQIQLRTGQREKPLDIFAEARDDLIARLPIFLFCDGLQSGDDLRSRRHAEIGDDEHIFEFVPKLGRQGPLRGTQSRDGRKDFARAAE